MEKVKKRLATLVGCNNPNFVYELHGCINDVVAMRDVLVRRFGFEPSNIQLLTDAPDSSVKPPTGANIKRALNQMIDQAEAGDVLVFHYSGHGTRFRSGRKYEEAIAIVPSDFNLITDINFRLLVNRLPEGASFTFLSDSCHSGGLIDRVKEQIGPSTVANATSPSHHPRAIPSESVLNNLASLSGIDSADIGTHLCEVFGSEASAKFLQRELLIKPKHPDAGILLSGCQANELSEDVSSGKKACGAFSNAVELVLKGHKFKTNYRNKVSATSTLASIAVMRMPMHPSCGNFA